jgi:SAM-dependent methyltransferase
VPHHEGTSIPDADRWNHNIHYHRLLLAAIPSGAQRALDVGCGEGTLARALRRQVPDVSGIDLDEAGIALARQQSEPDRDITYVIGDVLTHPFALASFDAIVSVATLHFLQPVAALTRLQELLTPGGVLAVVGVARSRLPHDVGWEAVSVATNLRYRLSRPYWDHPCPTLWPPPDTYDTTRRLVAAQLPGARFRRHALWRYSFVWTKPSA